MKLPLEQRLSVPIMRKSGSQGGLDMSDLGERRFGRRVFVRPGVAAGGLGLLAACAPAAPAPSAPAAPAATAPPAAAKPTEPPKPAAAAPTAEPTTVSAAAGATQTTTLKLLGWN